MLAAYELACQRHILFLSVSRPCVILPSLSQSKLPERGGHAMIADVEKWQTGGVLVYMRADSSIAWL
jgi:hypothetical protein